MLLRNESQCFSVGGKSIQSASFHGGRSGIHGSLETPRVHVPNTSSIESVVCARFLVPILFYGPDSSSLQNYPHLRHGYLGPLESTAQIASLNLFTDPFPYFLSFPAFSPFYIPTSPPGLTFPSMSTPFFLSPSPFSSSLHFLP